MTHAEQIKKRIKYFKMAIVHDEYGEVKWLCDSLTLAVEALEKIEKESEIGHGWYVAKNALSKISHGHLESSAFRPEGQ